MQFTGPDSRDIHIHPLADMRAGRMTITEMLPGLAARVAILEVRQEAAEVQDIAVSEPLIVGPHERGPLTERLAAMADDPNDVFAKGAALAIERFAGMGIEVPPLEEQAA